MASSYGVGTYGVAVYGGVDVSSTVVFPDDLVFPAARLLRWQTDPPPYVLPLPATPTLGGHYAVESLSPGVRGHG